MTSTPIEIAAVQAACRAMDVHLDCTFPECYCKKLPIGIKAALATTATEISQREFIDATGGPDYGDMDWTARLWIGARSDGGLRVWSDDFLGLILSGPDPAKVLADIWPAIIALREYNSAREPHSRPMGTNGGTP